MSHSRFKLPVDFYAVNELRDEGRLYLGEKSLDQLVGGLRPGQVAFFYGSRRCLTLSKILCVRVLFEAHFGRVDSKAIFIDGSNTFDPYVITQYAREDFPEDLDQVLDRILVSRAFTHHQLTSLITKTLPEEARNQKVTLIVVSDVVELYRDDMECKTLDLLKVAINGLVTTARLEKAIVLVTSFGEKTSELDPFLRVVKQRADIVLRLEGLSTRINLERHPTRSEGTIIKQPSSGILDEFLEVTADG